MSSITVADNAPLFIILNAGSGHTDTAATRAIIEDILSAAGRKHEIILVEDAAQLESIAKRTVEKARQHKGVIVMAGGDGSINTVAQATRGSGCAFGVLPQGTFNYFSRTHGIPADTAEATRVLLTSKAEPVQAGLVNGKVFLVSASLGLYPQLIEDREAYKERYGRSRLVAFIAGAITVLGQHRQLHLTLEQQNQIKSIRTPTLFVANNRLQLEQIGIPQDEAVESGQLVAITVRPLGTWGVLWLMIRGTFGSLGEADNIVSFRFKQLSVKRAGHFRSRAVKVATDGEICWLNLPLEFSVSQEPLYLLKPHAETNVPGRTSTVPE